MLGEQYDTKPYSSQAFLPRRSGVPCDGIGRMRLWLALNRYCRGRNVMESTRAGLDSSSATASA
jgi:hypothetical protein